MTKQIVAPQAVPQAVAVGQKTVIQMAKGQHLRVQELVATQAKDAGNVVALKEGQALRLKFADGTEIVLEGFYAECGANACSVTLAGEAAGSYRITADTVVGAATDEGAHLVYAYGDHNSLMALASGDTNMSAALASLGEGLVAYVPAGSEVGALGMGTLAAAGGGLALAAAAAGGGGGGGGGGASAGGAPISTVSGAIVGGPVIAGHGLTVEVYAADGTTKLGEATVNAQGQFTVNVGSYTGVVIARVVDADGGADYMDERTGTGKDLNATLMATTTVSGGTVTVNINVLTTIAAIKAGMNSDGTVATPLTSASVNDAQAAVEKAFGVSNLLGAAIITTVDDTGSANGAFDTGDGISNAERYGALLAAFSAVDADNGGNSQTTIDTFASGLSTSGSTGSLEAAALDALIAGAQQLDPGNTHTLVDIISNATTQTSVTLSINSVTTDNLINASEAGAVISGTAGAHASLTLTLGQGNTHTVTSDGMGAWSYTLQGADITAMGEGAATIRISDGSESATRGIYIDTIAPAVPVINSGSLLTHDSTPVLSGMAEANSTVTITLGGATYITTADSSDYWNLDTGTATPTSGSLTLNINGSNVVTVTAQDAAGNTSSPASQTLVIDTVAPATPVISSGTLTNDSTPVLSGTAEANSTVTIVLGGATYNTTADGSGHWSLDTGTATPTSGSLSLDTNGNNPVSVTAQDAAGNTSGAASQTLVIDTTAPTSTITGVAYDADTNTLTLTGTHFNTLLGSEDDSTTDMAGRMDWSKLVWDINGDGSTAGNVTFTAADIASVKAASGVSLQITLTDAKATSLEATPGFDAFTTNDKINVSAGFTRDAAGNAATADGYTGPSHVNTQIVVFDLVNGNSSSHSNRTFDPDKSYTIYVWVDNSEFVLRTNSEFGPPGANWGEWRGANTLGADDLIIITGNDEEGIDPVPLPGYSIGKIPGSKMKADASGWYLAAKEGGGSTYQKESVGVSRPGQVYRSGVNGSATKFINTRLFTAWVKDLGTNAIAPSAHFAAVIPAGILTSQGLV